MFVGKTYLKMRFLQQIGTNVDTYVYSFGIESPLKFKLTEEYANAYNRGLQAFFDAQTKFLKENGQRWTPDEIIALRIEMGDMVAFGTFNNILQTALYYYGKDVPEEDLTDDFLIKN